MPSSTARTAFRPRASAAPPADRCATPAAASTGRSASTGDCPAATTTVSAGTSRSAPSASRSSTPCGSTAPYRTPVSHRTPCRRSSASTAHRVLRLYHSALGRSGTSLALLLLGLGRAGERAAAKDPPAGPAHK
ncbi:hypothetical protein [Streptomyces sp900105755]|uniref:Uncharacterized protein n=1 Tax=Streptomyces sp. 900105755 TaxID=3154389 RepID=A0ABV1TGE2_9ACTN